MALIRVIFVTLLINGLVVPPATAVQPETQAEASSAPARRPNVLLIAIDDLNDWVGCLSGHPDTATPNIDRLAQRGTLFTNAHCQAPICNPSRTSILYGLRPSTSGVYKNGPLPWRVSHLDAAVTLPRWFARHGYQTATTGKLYHGSGLPQGDFDLVGPRPGQRNKELDVRLRKDFPPKITPLWDFGAPSYAESEFPDHLDASWAIEQLGRGTDAPFFLSVGFYRPHVPFYAPQRVFDQIPLDHVTLPPVRADDRDDIPEVAWEVTRNPTPPPHDWFVQHDAWAPAVQAYLACVRWTDEQVGRLLDALDESPHADNTIVVLYSDHGFHLGEKGRWTKFSLWERSTHVPFIISVPGLPSQQRCGQPAELLSIYPTLLELCDLPPNPAVDGRSIVPLLEDASVDWLHHAVTTHGQSNHAVRSDRYRYIRYHNGDQELYDMQADPHEWTNLVGSEISEAHAAIIEQLAKSLPTENREPARAASRNPRR